MGTRRPTGAPEGAASAGVMVIVEADGAKTALAVDELVGQQQVVAHERLDDCYVVVAQTHARPDHPDEVDTSIGVIARVSLADVVQERAEHEQVRTRHTVRQFRGVRSGLPQVSVDGEAVDGRGVRQQPDPLPLRKDAGEGLGSNPRP